MKYLIIILALLGCQSTFKIADIQNKEPIIILKKTSCKGKCPEYEICVYKEGYVTLKGIKNFELIGDFYKKMDKKQIDFFINQFDKANFFEFKDKYLSKKTDLPTTFLTFNYNGKSKKIMDYSDAPKELKELEKLIENISKEQDWISIKY